MADFVPSSSDLALLKDHTAALNRAADSNNALTRAITEAPSAAKDAATGVWDHAAPQVGFGGAGLIILYFALQGALAYVKSRLDNQNGGPNEKPRSN